MKNQLEKMKKRLKVIGIVLIIIEVLLIAGSIWMIVAGDVELGIINLIVGVLALVLLIHTMKN